MPSYSFGIPALTSTFATDCRSTTLPALHRFALYLSQFSAIGTIYGPYAFILVLLIWIYYSSIIFVIGAIVGQAYWERAKLKEAGKLRRWVDIEE